MPPARKKGASNNNNTNNNSNSNKNNNINNSSSNKIASELKLGDLVLGKVKGFPAWPAKISRPEDWERVPDPKKYFVQFFGTQEIAFIAPADIQVFTNESKSKLLARCKGKTVKYFAQAVKEICEAFEKLQNCDLHCRVDNTVALGCEASIIADGKVNGTVVLKTEDSSWSSQVYDPASLLGDRGPADNKQIADMKDSVTQPDEMMRRERGLDSVSLVDVKALITDSSPPSDIEGTLGDHKTDTIAYHERIESSRASSSSPYSSDPDVVRYSYNGAGKKDIHVSLEASGHHRLPSVGDKRLASRDKSKDLKTGPKKKIEGLIHHADQSFVKDQMLGKVSSGGNAKRSSSGANKFVSSVHGKTLKNLLKGQKQLNDSKDSPQKVVSGSGGHEDGEHNIRQKNGQVGQDQPQSAKKAKHMDRMGDASKGSAPNNGKDELESDMLSDEAVPPVAKRLRQTLEAVSCDDKRSIGIASLKHDIPKKRRAVQLYDDDDDEEPKTPVHGGSTSGCKVTSSTSVKKSYKNHESSNGGGQTLKNSSRDGAGNQKDNQPSTKFGSDVSLSDTLPQNLDNSKKTVSHGTGMEALDKRLVKDIKADLVSPTKSPQIFAALKKSAEQKPIRPFSKGNSIGSHSKALSISAKDPTSVSGHKSKQSLLVERARIPLKTGTRLTDSSASLDNQKDNDSVLDGRLEDAKDRSISLADPKTIDSAISMKNLIAAAQAKRRQAHTLNAPHANVEPVLAPSADLIGRSPSPSSTDPSFRGNWTPKDSHVLQSVGISASPSGHAQKLDLEEPDDKALSLVHQPAASALSGCTEAAVARDAFEGMIETLSRTKESIGRATRLAIDCAKYGIADEVVDLLTRKLENESSFHRRVDIFFLVDSITQCSHSQKGIAGASYLPSVQAALPRLLGAAAPAGPSARENRRQCLKVLRLWLERKILPESVLKRFMDDIGGSNDDTTSTGLAFRRPSRAERSVDDPIREMEGMLVDEYGSNATFNLPGFLSTHGFVDDEEDEDDILDTCHNQSNASPLNVSLNALAESEAGQVTPNDRRHHILEDVDGELEMEDVSGHPKDAVSSPYGMLEKEQGIQLYTEAEPSKDDLIEQSPLDGSPPLPLESPPPLPPLPTSPPPPPPPPLSPSPPPPPPPASTPVSYPLPPSLLPSGPPHAAICQPLLPLQPPVPPQVVMRPPSVIHPVQGGHPAQVAGNSLQQGPCFLPNGPSGSRLQEYGQNEMYPGPQAVPLNQQFQQLQPCQATFAQRAFSPVTLPPPPGHFTYNKPAVQQHMPHPRTHTPAPIPLPSHPYSTSNSEEQHMPHPRTHPPAPIPLPSHSYSASNSEGLRRFGDEQWRPALAEYKSDHHHNTWITEGRTQSCPTAKFIGEAYFRPPERPLTDNMTYHASAPNPVLAGPSTSGHGVNQMMPSRPELSSLSCWRPS